MVKRWPKPVGNKKKRSSYWIVGCLSKGNNDLNFWRNAMTMPFLAKSGGMKKNMTYNWLFFKENCLHVHLYVLWEMPLFLKHTTTLEVILVGTKLWPLNWPKMEQYIIKHIARSPTCHISKSHGNNTNLYTSLLPSKGLWKRISLDFMVGLLETQRNKDSVLVVIDCLLKIVHFIPCSKFFDALNVDDLYFQKIG